MKNTNNYTYAELQAMLEEAKGLAKEAVVDVIIANSSARNPMVASEIAERGRSDGNGNQLDGTGDARSVVPPSPQDLAH